jgi:hypothetical protein
MESKESFHKWANGGKTPVAYGPRGEGGYSLLEYNGGHSKERRSAGWFRTVLRVAANVVVVGRKCRNSLLLICRSKGA